MRCGQTPEAGLALDMNEPRISVVVCTYNRSALLRSCLESLVAQTLDKAHYEVLVVDNNCTDDTPEVVRQFAKRCDKVRSLRELRPGAGIARNTGIEASKAEFVAFVDDDGKADPDWLRLILEAFETIQPIPSAVGGPILPYYVAKRPEWFLDEYEVRSWGNEPRYTSEPAFSGSNMAFRRDVLCAVGGFPTGIGPMGNKMALGEDSVLTKAVYELEPKFYYLPNATVYHYVPPEKMTVRYRLKRAYMRGVSSVKVEGSRPGIAVTMKLVASVVARSVPAVLCTPWGRRNWQRSFLKHAEPIAFRLGRIARTVSGVKRGEAK